MQKYIGTAIKKDVNNPAPAGETPAVNADVRVLVTSTGQLATIYSDNGSTVIDQNTYKTDANGNHEFYAANGRYTIRYVLPSGNVEYTDVILYDKSDEIATTSEAVDATNDSKIMTPRKVLSSINNYGIGSFDKPILSGVNIESKPTGMYSGFGGTHPTATTGDNPFPTFGGSFSVLSSVGVSGGLDEYRVDLAFKNTNIEDSYRIRFRAANNLMGSWQEVHTSISVLYAENASGSTILAGAIAPGSSINPSKDGSYRCCSPVDLANGEGSIFIKVW